MLGHKNSNNIDFMHLRISEYLRTKRGTIVPKERLFMPNALKWCPQPYCPVIRTYWMSRCVTSCTNIFVNSYKWDHFVPSQIVFF